MKNNQDKNNSIEKLLYNLKDRVHPSLPMISAYAEEMLSEQGMSKAAEHIMQCQQCRQVYEDIKKEIDETDKPGFSEQDAIVPEMSVKLRAEVSLAAEINSKRNEIAEKAARKLLPQEFWPRIPFIISSLRNSSEEGSIEYKPYPAKTDYSIAAFDSGAELDDDRLYDAIKETVSSVDMFLNLLLERCDCSGNIQECCRLCSAELLDLSDENKTEIHMVNLAREASIESLSKDKK